LAEAPGSFIQGGDGHLGHNKETTKNCSLTAEKERMIPFLTSS